MPKVKAHASVNTTHREKRFTNGCTRKPPCQVSDLLEVDCTNYYAALDAEKTEDGAEGESPIQNEDGKKISADKNALIWPVGDPHQSNAVRVQWLRNATNARANVGVSPPCEAFTLLDLLLSSHVLASPMTTPL
jgi:hypothetical protein